MFGTFSHAPELIIVLIIALVIFGPKKLPDLGKGLGQGIKEFKRATTGEHEKEEEAKDAAGEAVSAASTASPQVLEAPKSSMETTAGTSLAAPPPPVTTVEHKS